MKATVLGQVTSSWALTVVASSGCWNPAFPPALYSKLVSDRSSATTKFPVGDECLGLHHLDAETHSTCPSLPIERPV